MFQALADGSQPISYQWWLNGVAIPELQTGSYRPGGRFRPARRLLGTGEQPGGSTSSSAGRLGLVSVTCWGEMGHSEGNVPARVTNVVAIASGYGHLALKSDGTVVAWDAYFIPGL